MKNLTYIITAVLLGLAPLRGGAEEAWCAVTDNDHIVVLSHINYLASDGIDSKFSIVLNDGSAIADVESIEFAKFHVGGIVDIAGDAAELRFAGGKIVISNARLGATLSIASITGSSVLSARIVADKQEVDISALAPGAYILIVDGKPMKFQKL